MEVDRSTYRVGIVAAALPSSSGVVPVSEAPVVNLYIVLESEEVMVEVVVVLMS